MKSFSYEITDKVGIHARPAGLIVKEAEKFKSDIEIKTEGGKIADAKRIFSVMGLGAKCGDTITININGSDEELAKNELQHFLKTTL